MRVRELNSDCPPSLQAFTHCIILPTQPWVFITVQACIFPRDALCCAMADAVKIAVERTASLTLPHEGLFWPGAHAALSVTGAPAVDAGREEPRRTSLLFGQTEGMRQTPPFRPRPEPTHANTQKPLWWVEGQAQDHGFHSQQGGHHEQGEATSLNPPSLSSFPHLCTHPRTSGSSRVPHTCGFG